MSGHEHPDDVAQEAARGRSERAPFLALGGVTLVIGIVVALVVAVALLLYLLL